MRKTTAREGVVGAVQNECSGMDEPLDIKGFHITGHPDDDVNGVYTKRDYGGLSNEQRKMVYNGLDERCFWTRKTESRLFCMTGDDAGVKGGGFDIQSFALPINDGRVRQLQQRHVRRRAVKG